MSDIPRGPRRHHRGLVAGVAGVAVVLALAFGSLQVTFRNLALGMETQRNTRAHTAWTAAQLDLLHRNHRSLGGRPAVANGQDEP